MADVEIIVVTAAGGLGVQGGVDLIVGELVVGELDLKIGGDPGVSLVEKVIQQISRQVLDLEILNDVVTGHDVEFAVELLLLHGIIRQRLLSLRLVGGAFDSARRGTVLTRTAGNGQEKSSQNHHQRQQERQAFLHRKVLHALPPNNRILSFASGSLVPLFILYRKNAAVSRGMGKISGDPAEIYQSNFSILARSLVRARSAALRPD